MGVPSSHCNKEDTLEGTVHPSQHDMEPSDRNLRHNEQRDPASRMLEGEPGCFRHLIEVDGRKVGFDVGQVQSC